MTMRLAYLGLFAALGATIAMAPADAGGRHDKRDPTFILRSHETDFVKTYPGDQALDGGAARFRGPDKGAYVERCYWTLNDPWTSPLNPTQRCVRYTLENTPVAE